MKTQSIWKSSADNLKNVKYLALIAAFVAMKIIVGNIRIPVSQNLNLSLTFILVALEASIVGPAAGMVSGMVADLLAFALFPDGAFFPGYTITAMCGELVYALFLYRKRISIARIAGAKLVNNYLVNVCMGSLWSSMLYGKAFIVYFGTSALKNTILLPIEIAILAAVFNLVIPFLQKHGWLIPQGSLPLKWK